MTLRTEQTNTVSPVAFIANQAKIDLSAPSSHIDKVSSATSALDEIKNKKAMIADIKKEMLNVVDPKAAKGPSAHAVPEAESPISGRSLLTDAAMAGVGFAVAGTAGVAVAGVVGAVMGVGSLLKSGSSVAQHQGTIHFGERGVEGGTMGLNENIGGKESGRYTDILGETWEPNGQAVKVSQNVAPAVSPAASGPNKLQQAVRDAQEMFTPKQMLDGIYSEASEDKLNIVEDSLRRRLNEGGHEVAMGDGPDSYQEFKKSLDTPKPLKALNVGMGAPSFA